LVTEADIYALQFTWRAGIVVLAAGNPCRNVSQQFLIKFPRLAEADGINAGTSRGGLLHRPGQNLRRGEPLVGQPIAEEDDDLLCTVWGGEESLISGLEPGADVGAVEGSQTVHHSTSNVVVGRQPQVKISAGRKGGDGYLVVAFADLALLLDHIDDVSSGALGRFDLDAAAPGVAEMSIRRTVAEEATSEGGGSPKPNFCQAS